MTPEPFGSAPATPEKAWLLTYHNGEDQRMTWANGLVEDVPPRTVSSTGSWEFLLKRGGERGRVDPLEHTDRYQVLQQLGRWAGRYVLKEPIESDPIYREQVPPGEPSVLVGLWPSYATPSDGIWGLIDSYDEQNLLPEAEMRVTLSLTMLAEIGDYESRQDVEGALSY